MKLRSPIQLTPDAQQSLTRLQSSVRHTRKTIGAKVKASIHAFKTTVVS